jgi:gamma-glutamyl hercynylcysteine S-oxide hydrolase
MCRVLAYLGPPLSLDALLLQPEHSLLRQSWAPRMQTSGVVNADGFGAGWYDLDRRPDPARYRTDRPMWSDRSFASLAGLVQSGAVLASVRSATPPAPVEESGTPPFTSGPWLFAHNGVVDGFRAEPGVRLRHLLSDRSAALLEGSSDSELLFGLTLDWLDNGADAGEALANVVSSVLSLTTARLNFVLTDGHAIAATACGDSLFVLDRTGLAGEGVIVASEPSDGDAGWQPVPDRSLVEARPGSVTVTPLDPASGGPS